MLTRQWVAARDMRYEMYCCQRGLSLGGRSRLLCIRIKGELIGKMCTGIKVRLSTFSFSLREESKLSCNHKKSLFCSNMISSAEPAKLWSQLRRAEERLSISTAARGWRRQS